MFSRQKASDSKTQNFIPKILILSVIFLAHRGLSKLIINPVFKLNSTFKWADASGFIMTKDFMFDFRNWRLECEYIDTQTVTKNSHTQVLRHYSLVLTYSVKKPSYIVRQFDTGEAKIALNDKIMYTSPVSPLEILMYEGPLVDPDLYLCGVSGLNNIAHGISTYNSIALKEMRLMKLETRLNLYSFDENEATIFQIRNFIYSNAKILKHLNFVPTDFFIKSDMDMVIEQGNLYLNMSNNLLNLLEKDFLDFVKNLKLSVETTRNLFETYFNPVKIKFEQFNTKLQVGLFNPALRDSSVFYLNQINFFIQEMLKRPKNLLFELVYYHMMHVTYSQAVRFEPLSKALEGLYRHLNMVIREGYNKLEQDPLGVSQIDNAFRELLDEASRIPALIMKHETVKPTIDARSKKSLLKHRIFKYDRFRGILKGNFSKILDHTKNYILKFFKLYMREPNHFSTLSKFDLIDDHQKLNFYRFWKFSRYIGQNAFMGFKDDPYRISLFMNQRSSVKLLI